MVNTDSKASTGGGYSRHYRKGQCIMSTETQRAEFNEAVSGFRMTANFGRGSSMTSALHEACDLLESQAAELAALKAENEALRKALDALNQARPVTFGGCPFCGRQDCVAGSCRHANLDGNTVLYAAMQTKEAS